MSAPVDRVLSALRQHGHEPRKSGEGWCCKCPAHDDRTPSLSIHAGDDGRALLRCHAGCTVDAVCGALGLQMADLFADESSRRNGHAPKTRRCGDGDVSSGDAGDRGMPGAVASDATNGHTFPTAREAVAELERRHGPRSKTWTYRNAGNEPVGLVVRWDTPDGKVVRPVSRKSDGSGWIIGGMPAPRPLYALSDLLATKPGDRVYVTEGEKAADAARSLGLTATTSPHGSKSADKADWSPLKRREVVILPDHDDAGERYADDVTRLVTAAGARSVRVVRLVELWAGLPEGGDLADYVAKRRGEGTDDATIRAEVEALADKADADTVTPEAPAVPAYVPFPVDKMPEPSRRYVTKAAEAIGCDVAYVALPLLAGMSSAIGNTRRIALKHGWTEPAILWTVIVGDSGTAKSPAMELALRPIRERQHEAMKKHAEAMRKYDEAMAMYERNVAQWRKSKSGTPPPAKPQAPIAERCWTDDVTTEALAVLLQQNPRGLLMVRDELAAWFDFDRYAAGKGGGDAAKWLEMNGGRPIMVDRKTGGTLYVPRAAVSIAGAIQPETLRRALGREHRDNGLAARLLLACPPRKPKRWTEAEVDADTQAALTKVFDRLYALKPETDDDGDEQPLVLTLTDEAKELWVRFYNEHAREQANLSGDEAAMWSKLEGNAARLALVIHETRVAADDPTLRDPARVDEVSIEAGVTLARWFGNEARRLYAILDESDEERERRRLVEWIERRGGTVTVRDLTHGIRAYRGDPDAAERALSALVEAGIGRWEADAHGPKGGRPAQRFRLVSTVTVTETPANAGKDVGYGDGDTGDTATNPGDGPGGTAIPPLADSPRTPPGGQPGQTGTHPAPPPVVHPPDGLGGPPAPTRRYSDPNDAPAGPGMPGGRFSPRARPDPVDRLPGLPDGPAYLLPDDEPPPVA